RAEWAWLGWLPHLRPAHGQDCRLLLAYDRDQTPNAPTCAAGSPPARSTRASWSARRRPRTRWRGPAPGTAPVRP
ncbi:hypothetical protein AB0M39_31170, partial [Streptomyces sp. NPDC051907]|uniref:hypothetical protein n=1 Tax=Streptomyces sp. NPDC051907 TaxID=3155284 RepID=UPI0034121EA4